MAILIESTEQTFSQEINRATSFEQLNLKGTRKIMKKTSLPTICIILPTYNEARNIPIIIPAIFEQNKKIKSHDLNVLVVDDNSPDGTADIVREKMHAYPNLNLITGPKKGIGEAYKKGINWANDKLAPDLIFQMDADLQHDPNLIPLFVSLTEFNFNLVIGSRFAPGGTTPDFSLYRKFISLLGNWLIRFIGGIPRIKDCTSGYRCIKSDLIKECDLSFLATRGYSFQSSLLCELLRNGARVIEIPINFLNRKHGDSKLSVKDQVEFLLNIPKIRFNKSQEFIKFCIVGFSGVFVNMSLYFMLTRIFDVPLIIASPIAIETSILTNFALNNIWTFKHRNNKSLRRKIVQFHTVASLAGITNFIVLSTLVNYFKIWDISANLVGIIAGTLLNYSMNSLWTWKK